VCTRVWVRDRFAVLHSIIQAYSSRHFSNAVQYGRVRAGIWVGGERRRRDKIKLRLGLLL